MKRIPNQKYIDSTFQNKMICQSTATFNELQQIKHEETDLFVNEKTGEISYQPRKGKRKYFSGNIPGLGYRGWQLLLDIIWAAGEWIELNSSNHVNARVLRLRNAFGDSAKKQWFFETRRSPVYSIRWNPDRSWRFVEKKAGSDKGSRD